MSIKRTAELLGGAFVGTFEKGRWKYTPTFNTIKKSKGQAPKEPPQFDLLLEIESAASKHFQSQTIEMSKEICKFITKL